MEEQENLKFIIYLHFFIFVNCKYDSNLIKINFIGHKYMLCIDYYKFFKFHMLGIDYKI